MNDAIDRAAGLSPGDRIADIRRRRPEFVDGAEACLRSVLVPKDDQGLSADIRLALAHRIACLNKDLHLQQDYQQQLIGHNPSPVVQALAAVSDDLPEPFATLARHTDLVTCSPSLATEQHIHLLEQAGLTNGQIVALSELIAFVNFQTRVVAGLRLLRSA